MADRRSGRLLKDIPGSLPTYYALYDTLTVANNKYMATLFNTSATRKVVVTHVHRYMWATAPVTGGLKDQYLARITARTAGTGVTIRSEDPADTLSTGITADTDSTSVTEAHIVQRFVAVSEEMILTGTGLQQLIAVDTTRGQQIYSREVGQRGVHLRQNQGLTVRNVTSGTAGRVSYIFRFFDLPA